MMRRTSHFLVLPLLLLAAGIAAGAEAPPPDGVTIGNLVLQPSWATYLEYDDNIFRRDVRSQYISGFIHNLVFGLGADIPVSNSLFEFDYEGNQRNYGEHGDNIGRNLTHELAAKMTMKFGSGDRLTLSDDYTLGATDLQIVDDVGDELVRDEVFRGEPYTYNRWAVELAREVPRMQGYSMKVTRLDMIFDAEECDPDDPTCFAVPFFDYRGFQSVFQYRHPLPVDNWLVGYYDFRLLDNYTPKNKEEGSGLVPEGPGVLFRTEHSNSYQVGLGGYMWQRHPFLVRAGLGHFRYSGLNPSDSTYRGLVGHARLRFNLGSSTELNMSLDRRPLPSNYPTYYINNALRVQIDRKWLQYSKVGFRLNLSRNEYGDSIEGLCSPGVIRMDDRVMADGHVEWKIHRLVGLRVAASHWRRTSNCDTSEYSANVISAGIELGWN